MSTSIVLVPVGQLLPISSTQDMYHLFEIDDGLIVPVKPRPVMPGIADWKKCKTVAEVCDLACGVVVLDHAPKETEEEGDS